MPKDVDPRYFNSIDEATIQGGMRGAQDAFWANERQLLNSDANERTLCGRFAFHLIGEFPRFDVDIEYNRNHAERDYRKKLWDRNAIRAILEARGIPNLDERQAQGERDGLIVLPDIIVHIRDQPVNLLIIEAKKSSSRISPDADRAKLDALRRELEYRYAAFILFPTGADAGRIGNGPDWFTFQ